jgi:hypothetical protein
MIMRQKTPIHAIQQIALLFGCRIIYDLIFLFMLSQDSCLCRQLNIPVTLEEKRLNCWVVVSGWQAQTHQMRWLWLIV